ncbi:MAG: bifunctional biotin--[acetyl-CoA-carboxylase] ligase/biotin operon repressor BirA [Enterobacterales bacterium]|nr:bifunctional biotin--[acetyl-CoA-carboxylase] ligase/biotin operon repressor BirA [Enterobacterales bacterium]
MDDLNKPSQVDSQDQTQSRDSQRRIQSLIKLLADGQFHSGQSLAETLHISRTAVWKMIEKLKQWQIVIFSVRGKGYKIDKGLMLLDQAKIDQALTGKTQFFSRLVCLPSIDSTSSYIAREWQKSPGQPLVCVAEHQTKGRGRKGRKWISPFASNLYFSLGFNLPFGLHALGGLSLAIGICMARVLNQMTLPSVKLKWPNDLLIEGKKLAGILVEASGDKIDNSFINIGIGLNWRMASEQAIDQEWCNLTDYLTGKVDRNELLIQILLELDQCLQIYCRDGFDSFSKQWRDYSAFIDQPICIETRQGKVLGKELGINSNGAIRVMTDSGESIFYSGEVSLRPA